MLRNCNPLIRSNCKSAICVEAKTRHFARIGEFIAPLGRIKDTKQFSLHLKKRFDEANVPKPRCFRNKSIFFGVKIR